MTTPHRAHIHPSRQLINRVDLVLDVGGDSDDDYDGIGGIDSDFLEQLAAIKPRTDLDVDGRPSGYSPLDTHW